MSSVWSAALISADAANSIQVDAGTLLKRFNPANPVKPVDADILATTTGDFTITEQPEFTDFLEDVNNAPNGTMQGVRINKWNRSLSGTSIEFTKEGLKFTLGAAQELSDGGIATKRQVSLTDFNSETWWIGDMTDETMLFAIKMENTLSTGGLSLSTTKNGKGKTAWTITPHPDLRNIEKSPMTYYLLTKSSGSQDSPVKEMYDHVTSDLETKVIDHGENAEITLTADTGYEIETVVVLMNGEDITSTAWNSSTGKVTITSANGDIVIIAVAVEEGA